MKDSTTPSRLPLLLSLAALVLVAALVLFPRPSTSETPNSPAAAGEMPPGSPGNPAPPALPGASSNATAAAATAAANPGAPNDDEFYLRPLRRSAPRGRAGYLTGPQAGAPLDLALDFARNEFSREGLSGADLATALVSSQFQTRHNGVTHVHLRQSHAGLEVYNGDLTINVARDGRIISMHDRFVPGIADEVNALDPALPAAEAVTRAAAQINLALATPLEIVQAPADGDPAQSAVFTAAGISEEDIPVKLMLLPRPGEETRLVWNTRLRLLDGRHWWDLNVDAETGAILSRANWIAAAGYNVYPLPIEHPEDGARSLQTDVHDPASSPHGWHDTDNAPGAEFTDTRGNNVFAQEDTNADNSGGTRPDGGAGLQFDYPLDLGQSPSSYQPAALSNLFYWNNICHDVHHRYGFDEAAGNFQENNYANGGVGGDPVQADAQDGSGTDNANFATPPDGSDPRMQMFEWTSTSPNRDSDLDNVVIIHEYGHGVSNRLTGGPANSSALTASQSRGMGEGWSDWWGLALTADAAHVPTTHRSVGVYLLGQPQNGPGIRPAPYTTDIVVNALTYGDLSGGGLSVPHGLGTVWCTALWEFYWNLVNTYGFDPDFYTGSGGNNIALQLVMDGLKLQPTNPTFLDARDAILQADLVNNGGANELLIWQAFAKRGMGFSAEDGGSADSLAVTEAFDIPDDLRVDPPTGFTPQGPENGPFTPISETYTLTNTVTVPVNWTASSTAPWLSLNQSGGSLGAGATTDVIASLSAVADTLLPGTYTDAITITNTDSGAVFERPARLSVTGIATLPFNETWESGAFDPWWQVTGTGTYRTLLTSANTPRSGNYHVTMDSSAASSSGRNELTLNVDLANYENVTLTFWAREWTDEANGPPPIPHTGGADYDGVAISEDGVNWYEVLGLRDLSSVYERRVIDLDAAIATHGLTYNDNFKVRFNHFDNWTITSDGFGFDDISITGDLARVLTLALPAGLTEGDGVIDGGGTVFVTPAPPANLTVNLSSDLAAELGVPASVTILAGETSTDFDLTVGDDGLLDGSQPVAITATSPDYVTGIASTNVDDNETATLTINVLPLAAEGAGTLAGQGSVSVSSPVGGPVTVHLSSDDPGEVTVPATVIVPTGQSAVAFPLTIIDDNEIDGSQVAQISAAVANWTGDSDDMTIADNESLDLALSFSGPFTEGDGTVTNAGTVSIDGTIATNLTIALSSSDPSEVTLPASATILAGQTATSFDVTVEDDGDVDGTIALTATATATGFAPATEGLSVSDNEVASFTFANVPNPQRVAAPFSITVTARDIEGNPAAGFTGTASLSATAGGGALATVPAATGNFSGGSWTGEVTVNTVADDAELSATSGPATGTSNSFDVLVGELAGFQWDAIADQQAAVPFAATVRAIDALGNTVTSFDESVTVRRFDAGPPVTGNLLGSPAHSVAFSGPNTSGQAFTPSVDLIVTHVRHYFGTKVSIWTDGGGLLAEVPVSGDDATWMETPLPSPLHLTSGVTYRVSAYSAPGDQYYLQDSVPETFAHGTIDGTYSTNADAFPATAVLGRSTLVGLSYEVASDGVTPDSAGPFVDGSWTGNLTIPEAAAGAILSATSSSAQTGNSNTFNVDWLGSFALNAPGTVAEGDGLLAGVGTISLNGPAPAHLTIALTSSEPGEITVPATVTIPMGTISAPFDITVIDDAALDGSVVAGIIAELDGYRPDTHPITVDDNETASLFVTAPSVAFEGAGALTGQGLVAVSRAPDQDVTVHLSVLGGVPEVTVPATVIIPAGQTASDPFTVTIGDNNAIDGMRFAFIDATVASWGTSSAQIIVLDDEDLQLELTLPSSVTEGEGTLVNAASVAISGTFPTAVTVTLSSNDSGEIQPAASVVIPQGQTSASFNLIVPDDGDFDGTQLPVITATAAASGFIPADLAVEVRDNDLHHLEIAFVPSPQIAGRPIDIVVSARDINGGRVSTSAALSEITASGDSGSLPGSAAPLGSFVDGIWNGSFTVDSPDTNVVLNASAGAVAGSSNPFNVTLPNINVFPTTIDVTLRTGETTTESFNIANNGTGNLNWQLSSTAAASALPPAPRAEHLGENANANAGVPLQKVLDNLNAGFSSINSLIPNRYDFTDGESGTAILDGGNDMFDTGNQLNTDLLSLVPYADNTIQTTGHVGGNGAYFTRKYPGLFVFAADIDGATEFSITGNLGADGNGSAEEAVLTSERGALTYQGFLKRVYGAGDPSVNHLIIVADQSAATHEISLNTDDDFHRVSQLAGTTRLYYLLYAGASGGFIDDATAQLIMEAFLDSIGSPAWLTFDPDSGTVAENTSQTVTLGIDASSLAPGVYADELEVTSDDPDTPSVFVTVNLSVTPNAPALTIEPLATGGTTNEVHWQGDPGFDDYEAQAATEPSFAAPVSSGWITGTSHLFTSLVDGQRYHFRLRGRTNVSALSVSERANAGVSPPSHVVSGWSDAESSLQDATPPSLYVSFPGTPAYTTAPGAILSGSADDTNGISAVTINTIPASGSGSPYAWTGGVTGLALGSNSLAVRASDNALPPNEVTVNFPVERVLDGDGDGLPADFETTYGLDDADNGSSQIGNGPLGDTDGDGIVQLLEFMLHLNPNVADVEGLPTAFVADGGDGKRYLYFEYRRRIGLTGHRYEIETGSAAAALSHQPALVQEISAHANIDGVTETVQVKCLPAVEDSPLLRGFARLVGYGP